MSVKVMGQVWDADLPRPEKYVLLAYADHAAHDGTNIYPSVPRVAWKTGYTERSIRKITGDLVEMGILVPDGKRKSGVNKYRLDVSALPSRPEYGTAPSEESTPEVSAPEDSSPQAGSGVKKTASTPEKSSPKPSGPINKEEPSGIDLSRQMFGRLAELCQINLELVSKKDRGKLNSVTKKLLDAGKKLGHIDNFERYWYAVDWRGQKGQPPDPYDVTREWERARRWLNGGNHDNGRNRSRSRGTSQGSGIPPLPPGRTRPWSKKELAWIQRERELEAEGKLG